MLSYIFIGFLFVVVCSTAENDNIVFKHFGTKLHEDLIRNSSYKKSLRSELKVPLQVSFTLCSIYDFDEIKGNLYSVGIIYLSWNDTRLSWNQTEYGHVPFISFHLEEIWRPSISLLNSIDKFELLGREMDKSTVWVTSLGTVHYAMGGVFRSSCDPNVEHFPFDVHECYLLFVPFDDVFFTEMFNDTISLTEPLFEASDLQDADGKWIYKSLKPCIHPVGNTKFNGAIFPVFLERRWKFIFLNIVIPILLLGYLNIFVFLIPVEAGERVSFAITVLLSYTVFMIVVASTVPETSYPMPLISYFLVFKLAYSACIVISIVVITRLSHREDETAIPKLAMKITLLVEKAKSVICCERHQVKNDKIEHPSEEEDQRGELSTSLTYANSVRSTKSEEAIVKETVTWSRVSRAFDKLFLCFFLLIVALETVAFFITLLHYHEKNEIVGDHSAICDAT